MIVLYILLPIVLILFSIWLFLVAPVKNKKMNEFKTLKYAHRGLHGKLDYETYAAENSITAFSRAADRGFGIELDVRLTKEGECIVFHDDTLDRVTNGEGRVKDFTLEELKKLSLEGTGDTIPTFAEVLKVIEGRVPLLVELKEDAMDSSVAFAAAKILREYNGPYIIESFNPLVLGKIKKELPEIPRGFLDDKHTANEKYRTMKYRIVQRFLLNFIARPSFIAMNHERPKMFPLPFIRAVFNTPCLAWTIRSKEEEKQAEKNGFSGVIFENYIAEMTDDKNDITLL